MTDHDIVRAALRIPDPTDRDAYLDKLCDGDPDRRRRLAAHLAAGPAGAGETATQLRTPPGRPADRHARPAGG